VSVPSRRPDRVRIVYILGSGRCGSTLLDAILGTGSAQISAGELDALPRAMRRSTAGDEWGTLTTCSCGRPISRCELWTAVWQDIGRSYGVDSFQDAVSVYERVLVSLPQILAARALGTRRFRDQLDHLGFVARSIAEHSGRTVVVDSSKNPARGWMYELLSREQFDVRFVHLVRDGRAVVDSNLKHFDPTLSGPSPPPWGPAATAGYSTLYWLYMNLHSSLLGRKAKGRYVRVNFDRLMVAPRREIERLGRELDLDLSEALERIGTDRPMERGHIVLGNRSKLRPPTVAEHEDEERVALPGSASAVFGLLGGWLNRLYSADRPAGTGG
jgi:hypothetical protein